MKSLLLLTCFGFWSAAEDPAPLVLDFDHPQATVNLGQGVGEPLRDGTWQMRFAVQCPAPAHLCMEVAETEIPEPTVLIARGTPDWEPSTEPGFAMVAVRTPRVVRVAVRFAGEPSECSVNLELVPGPPVADVDQILDQLEGLPAPVDLPPGEWQVAWSAIDTAVQALPFPRSLAIAQICYRQGLVAMDGGALAESITAFRKASARYDDWLPTTHYLTRRAHGGLANALQTAGRLSEALQSYRVALQDSGPRPGTEKDQNQLRMNYATLLAEVGDLESARTLLEELLEEESERQGLSRSEDMLILLANLAACLADMGLLQQAREIQEELVETLRRRQVPVLPLGGALNNLGNTWRYFGDHWQAAELFEEALDTWLVRVPADHPAVLIARVNLAGALMRLEELEAAADMLAQALEDQPAGMPRDAPLALLLRREYALVRHLLGDDDAIAELRELVQLAPPGSLRRNLQARLASLLVDAGDTEEAREMLGELLEFTPNEATVTPSLLTDAALVWGKEHPARCLESIERCLRVRQERLSRWIPFQSPRAVEAHAAGHMKELRRLLPLLATLPEGEERQSALGLVWRSLALIRAAPLWSAAIARRAGVREEGVEIRQELRALTEEIAAAAEANDRTSLSTSVQRRDALLRELMKPWANPTRAPWIALPDRASWFRGLPKDSVLVTYLRALGPNGGGDRDYALTVESQGPIRLFHLGPSREIRRNVDAWLQAVLTEAEDEQTLGQALNEVVLRPLLSAHPNARSWQFSLDGDLHRIPLDALPTDEKRRVMDEYRVTVCSTHFPLSWLTQGEELLSPASRSGELLAVGGLNYAGEQASSNRMGRSRELRFVSLPESELEVGEISRLFQDSREERAWVLTGSQADKESVRRRAEVASYVHLATHGFRGEGPVGDESTALFSSLPESVYLSPMTFTGLALTGANQSPDHLHRRPGILRAEELAAWNLQGCELVTLSACETGVGMQRDGLSVASLRQALLMAGVKETLTSLWPVPERATRMFMEKFYDLLWNHQRSVADAWSESRRALRQAVDRRGRPRYTVREWAAWVHCGK